MAEKEKRILITGATGVIGGAIATAFARNGVMLALHYFKSDDKAKKLEAKVKELGAKAILLKADLSIIKETQRLIKDAVSAMGGIDILVHTPAVFAKTPLGEVTEEDWDRTMRLNIKGVFFLAQAASLAMQREGGQMIFMSDVASQKSYAGYLPYCLAKAGIDALVRGLARSLAPKIQVNAIAPYIVSRPAGMSDRGWNDLINKTPMRRPSTPEEIAQIVKVIAETGESITGQIIAVDGGRLLR